MNFQTIAASKPQGTLPSDGVPLKKNLPDRQRLVRKLKSMYEDRRDLGGQVERDKRLSASVCRRV